MFMRLMSQSVILPFLLFGIYAIQIKEYWTSATFFLICALHLFHLYELKKGRIE